MICPNCGSEIPEYERYCHYCGNPTFEQPKKRRRGKKVLKVILLILGFCVAVFIGMVIGVYALTQTSSTSVTTTSTSPRSIVDPFADAKAIPVEEFKASCEDINHRSAARDPSYYNGRYIKFTGTVFQVIEGYGRTNIMMYQDNADPYSFDSWYILYDQPEGSSRILENDRLTVYGVSTGITTYTTVQDEEKTIPSMQLLYYDLLN